MRIRGHNLLCIQGFVGKGYSPEFIANMTRVIESLPGTAVTVVDDPDVLCNACPNLLPSGCELHGPGTEAGILLQDRVVMARLGIEAGETLSWEEILERVHARVAPDDLDEICGNCPWLPLGHCKEGLRH